MVKGMSKPFILILLVIIALLTIALLFPPGYDTKDNRNAVGCANNIKILLSSIDDYKSSNNGTYPNSLVELYPKYVKNALPKYMKDNKYYIGEEMVFKCVASKSEGSPSKPPYVYIKPAPDASPDTIVLIDNNHKNSKIIGYKNGTVKIIKHSLLKRVGANIGT